MTNKIKYNEYPNKEEFCKLYESLTQQNLAEFYGCNKLRIRKWIDHFGLDRRKQGGGNNRKYTIDENQLRKLVLDGYSNNEILEILNIKCKSSLCNWLKKFNINRIYGTEEHKIYYRKVRWLTEKIYSEHKNIINPNSHPRTLCGVEGGYQLDHIMGVADCFINEKSVEYCASVENLQMIPWKENLEKRKFGRN